MKVKRLFLLLPACLVISGMTASAKSEHYSDDFVSFDYDTDLQQCVSVFLTSISCDYTCRIQTYKEDPDAKDCSLSIISKEMFDTEEFYEGFFNNENFKNIETVSESPLTISCTMKDDSGLEHFVYRKYLGENDSSYAYADLSCPSALYDDYLLSVFDSFSLNEGYYTDFAFIDELHTSRDYIYSNITLSEQMYNYVNKAIEISNEYLDFTLSQEEASEQIEQLVNRCEKYYESSDYYHDKTAYYDIQSLSMDITYSDDYDLLEDIEELKVFCSIE